MAQLVQPLDASPDSSSEQTSRSPISKWGLDEGDLSLIRWMLELTPTGRLKFAQGFAQSAAILRDARRT